ncbi:MAG TPA: hypothetical protein QGI07_09380 [Dehalococcoidia bacterium]|jgi:quercetin dioxygenase-like cupin family protein|nr:hypothetical protein [Chloroflexota bacterium]MDP5876485.1 hypothetical protein [Dehalococcoidia bacterium]MDP6274271.1 hypothetical protein [Dehalococcoidia bacterium]MDP7161203.1 hypothetical protein [Dehalococcoidia bacterium]MDP7213561.1 hypothetical protein [Dehalococcoidia bacterium]|tara:strand:+ start:177 stop:524 length:348 start_codon:yes stop_codon:yes gene_type:complete
MKVTRVYTGDDGESHFEDIDIELNPTATGALSEPQAATNIIFRETSPDYNLDFHTAPRRQYVINLSGAVEIEVGDGSTRLIGTGEILLAEDTTGHGHISRAVAGQMRRSLFVTLD